ncbi:hypothetical protein ABZ465_09905 [Streptomyces griseoincarnatus]
MIVERAQVTPWIALLGPLGFMCPFMIGLWAGRRRILERTEQYGILLRVTASVGVCAAALDAQPVALMLAGVVPVPDRPTLSLIGPLHDATGVLGGLGYASCAARWFDAERVTHGAVIRLYRSAGTSDTG